MAKADLTAQRLRELLHYDPKTGAFAWSVDSGKKKVGDVAGSRHSKGYQQIRHNGNVYLSHRLAWLYVYGSWPQADIDHINGDRADNRIANLRDVSRSVNLQNQRVGRGKGGLIGAVWINSRQCWHAQIKKDRRSYFLGRFDSEADAHSAYLAAKRKLHEGCTI